MKPKSDQAGVYVSGTTHGEKPGESFQGTTGGTEHEPIVRMVEITKRFGEFVANDRISLDLYRGEIHALLGENGAGKTTLMNVLFGYYQPDGGKIFMNGHEVVIKGPDMAHALGIGMVHQHFKLVDRFTVTENIILGAEPRAGFTIDRSRAREIVERLAGQYGLYVDPDRRIEEITIGAGQRVEILKMLYRGADVLILDEPTAVLTPQEVHELLNILRSLAAQGKAILLITHKLKEILAVADRVTIIRRGRLVGTLPVRETDAATLAEMMVGRRVIFNLDKAPFQPGRVMLTVRDVKEARSGADALKGVSFSIRAGEIYGIAGVDGNGQSALIEALTGLRRIASGEVLLEDKPIHNANPRTVFESGVGHIPEDRHRRGLILDFPLYENLVLNTYYQSPYTVRGLIQPLAMQKQAERLIQAFDVRASHLNVPARALSGGNQQKAIIARELSRRPKLLIAAQPTRGLDVGAIEAVHREILKFRDAGGAVLLISFELDEILALSDRIGVMYEGRLVGEVLPHQTSEEALGLMMAGQTARGVKEA
ncbi:MAG: Unspecified monosaccharide ABC transport system, ATP-binding protein [Candidatus Carbobacillus altaicus]|uniref:Unspecified monosaccharide ABC transport system, ATP-binding protein n=1 Tax=Candidatus Carbonibacillus altaicus TaxID=2163959 RepID=A0A2R6XZR6_9BACL|nr:MAG: Unspecified monosaccharide ABC transport system, ATP-binding protein [Candidatus Carbobacillus altaicus]